MNNYHFDEIKIGHEESFSFSIDGQCMDLFQKITGDINPLHTDRNYALKSGFKDRVVYGMLTASFLSTACGVWMPGERSLIHEVESIKFLRPAYIGDYIAHIKVTNIIEALKCLCLKIDIQNEEGQTTIKAKMKVLVREYEKG